MRDKSREAKTQRVRLLAWPLEVFPSRVRDKALHNVTRLKVSRDLDNKKMNLFLSLKRLALINSTFISNKVKFHQVGGVSFNLIGTKAMVSSK